ncbi:MAG TPA: alpha/beta hydrolase [Acidimicrobiia bacterium]|nr:alpha/beta hydrolase [Acidimicrobiia bacterium]
MTTTHQVTAGDGTRLYVESTGSGTPILFIHEFAGDHRSWEPQVRAFSRLHRCVAYTARGYPPSDVPDEPTAYSQDNAVSDAIAVLDGLGIDQAHIVGLSMGGFCALHLTLSHPKRVLSTAIGGVGYGALPGTGDAFRAECEVIATAFESEGAAAVAQRYAVGPARVQFQKKDPKGHAEFARMLAEHSALGSAGTMRGFQKGRPSVFDFQSDMSRIATPFLIMVGDEDEGAIEPSVMMKRQILTSGLMVFPRTGHTLNLEEPRLFNSTLGEFLAAAEAGRWHLRDPRSLSASTTGMGD